MSKKIFVIEDWEVLRMKIQEECRSKRHPYMVEASIEADLLEHELKGAIQFEAGVQTANETLEKPLVVFSPDSELDDKFAEDDEVTCLIFRKEK